jgi:S-DNA-T family DNA segregation ATPase FtsK/SpoIIIE
VLIGGATGSGKGSVIWSLIRSLASGIQGGWVQVWAADPKGGMELGHGTVDGATGEPTCPLFARFARDAEAIANLLGAAVDVMADRARALSGVARQHQPTVAAPAIVVIIDELAALATYGTEQLRERVRQHLGILLSQGRALGVHVVAAVQDPGQVHVSVRRAFPTRIALRTVEADQVDMILGKGAWAGGARCELIPETAQGCGWVLLDGDREPTWVRASWVADTDIAAMAATYAPAPTRPAAGDHEAIPTAEPDAETSAADELEDVA